MNSKIIVLAAVSSFMFASAASANSNATVPDKAGFVNTWHGLGHDHQANNNPGDTAVDRHNFGNATAGKSGNNPTTKSRK